MPSEWPTRMIYAKILKVCYLSPNIRDMGTPGKASAAFKRVY